LRTRRVWQKARLAGGIAGYLREPLTLADAHAQVRMRMAARESRFLELVGRSIFGAARSPHRKLLAWAGWDRRRLKRSVYEQGIEATLEALHDEGVWTSLEEFKARAPIRRDGLLIEPRENDFDNPLLMDRVVRAASSGTASGVPIRVPYDWSMLREEAALECLLLESHGVLDAPCAFWLPGLPSVSGLHNLLVHMRLGRPPERWFSQLRPRVRDRLVTRFICETGRAFGMRVPAPEATSVEDSERVAIWMASTRDRAGVSVLKTFASSAVRVAEAALRSGIDLRGCVVLAGGETLTERRTDFVASTGARMFARYVATETGWIAGGCPQASSPDAMHLYSDRIGAIRGPGDGRRGRQAPLLLTTLSPSNGKILLNTDIGDQAKLSIRSCECPLGRAGLDVELSAVEAHDKLSGEGITVAAAILSELLDELIAEVGGAPDSYHVREEEDETGASRVVIVLSPEVRGLDDADLIDRLLTRLRAYGDGPELAAKFWRDAATIRVRRELPALTSGQKMRAIAPLEETTHGPPNRSV
jgi:hypothetical protein